MFSGLYDMIKVPTLQVPFFSQVPIKTMQGHFALGLLRPVTLNAVCFKKWFDVRFKTGFP